MPPSNKKPKSTPQVEDSKAIAMPKNLRPFHFHGLRFDPRQFESKEATADCPFCGRENKFSVNIESGLWRCIVCNIGADNGKASSGGNIFTFMRLLWKISNHKTTNYDEIRNSRKLLDDDTLIRWGVCKSITTGEWLIPGYGADGTSLNQLYRYAMNREAGKRLLYATSELNQQIHNITNFPFSELKQNVYICEGPWDAMALWEMLHHTKRNDDGTYSLTTNPKAALIETCSVVAAPGCNIFPDAWGSIFADRVVVLMYDSDHPKTNPSNGQIQEATGYAGMRRVAQVLAFAESPPREIHYLNWGTEGFDPKLPSGHDIRDTLSSGKTPLERVPLLAGLLKRISPMPDTWVAGRSKSAVDSGSTDLMLLPCSTYKMLTDAWEKPMRWTPGLDRALSFMLSISISTKSNGDQLWGKVIGPPSCGKSTLCEALNTNKKYVLSKSTITGFHSGYKSDNDGEEDHSLIAQAKDKTLITKDGDTLLQAPNFKKILSEARDLYDTTSRAYYRHGLNRDYEGIRMTWILCGTNSLREIDESELGARFLDCVIMEGIDDDLEDEILWRVANRTASGMATESNGELSTQHDPTMLTAMQLTGGYVKYLRENAVKLMNEMQKAPDEMLRLCTRLGKFVAFIRARPSTRQDEKAEREFGARLVSQLTRLAVCTTIVLNKNVIDMEVMDRVRHVALDTARGVTLDIVTELYKKGAIGHETKSVAIMISREPKDTEKFMLFLKKIGVIERHQVDVTPGVKGRPRWRLTEKFRKLYEEVVK